MDRGYISPYSDDFIDQMVVKIMSLPKGERSAEIENIEFSKRIFDFPLKHALVHSERQIRSILVRISGVAHDLRFKSESSKNIYSTDLVSSKNKDEHKLSVNRRENYRARYGGYSNKSYYEIKESKYWCDAYVLNILACDAGFKCALITITAQKEYHDSNLFSTAEIVKILNGVFKNFTSKLRRNFRDSAFGFKVIQFHKSGTPHLHSAIFYDPGYEKDIRKLLGSSLKNEPIGYHQFKPSSDEYDKDNNKIISYLSHDISNEDCEAALSKFNGCSSRSFQVFGKCLKTTLFDNLTKKLKFLHGKGGVFEEIYDLLASGELSSKKKYTFLKKFASKILPIERNVVSRSGMPRTEVIGLKCVVTSQQILWAKDDESCDFHYHRQNEVEDSTTNQKIENVTVNVSLTSVGRSSYSAVLTNRFPRLNLVLPASVHNCLSEAHARGPPR